MENIATCPNGHNYDANIYETCPYCPNSSSKTVIEGQQNPDRTIPENYDNGMRTQIVNEDSEKTIPMKENRKEEKSFVPKGTVIYTPEQDGNEDKESHSRKLVAYLTSYDISKQGKSFKLFEGKNLIGSDVQCDIIVSNDPGISGKHLTILYRNKTFRFRDEFSTNGTKVNKEMLEEGTLDESALIELGATKFIFTAIPLNLLDD